MSISGQRLSLGLDDLPAPDAQRVRLFRLLLATAGVLRTRMDRRLASDGRALLDAIGS